MSINKAITHAWADPAYKAKLLRDPAAALAEAGVTIAAGINVKVVEDTADTKHLALPIAPANAGALSDWELEKLVGGAMNPFEFTAVG